jgi:hypothetical protein
MESKLEHIRRRLINEGQKTSEFFEALAPQDRERQIYATGSGWRVKEILAHFISAERAYQRYLGEVLAGGFGPPDDLDIDQFNEADVSTFANIPFESLLDTYRQTRFDTVQFTYQMNEDDLQKVANHPWFDEKEIGWYLKLLYRHNTMHRMDIRKSIKLGTPLEHSEEQRTGRQVNP